MNAVKFRLGLTIAVLAFSAFAPARTWYYSGTGSPAAEQSRVDGYGFPNQTQIFNIVNVSGIEVLRYIKIETTGTQCGLYRIVVRRGNFTYPEQPCYTFFAAPLITVTTPPNPSATITLAVPATALFPGQWSVSVAMDTRFTPAGNMPAMWTTNFAYGFTGSVATGQLVYQWQNRGLIMQLSDSL
jgi:hypothetical protein